MLVFLTETGKWIALISALNENDTFVYYICEAAFQVQF